MNDIVTVKDAYAAALAEDLEAFGATDADEMARLLIQSLEQRGLMPTDRQYSVGGQDLEFGAEVKVYDQAPAYNTDAGEYLVTRYVTGWFKS